MNVSVAPVSSDPPLGTGAAIMKALRDSPPVDRETLDEFDRILQEGKRPASKKGAFDDLLDE